MPLSPEDDLARELARSEQNLRTLIDHAQVGLLVHRGGPIVFANPSLVATLGYRDGRDLVGRHFSSVFHGHDLAGKFDSLAVDPGPVVARLAGADGRVSWAEVRGVVIEYDGAPAMLLLLRDLTGERRTRATLREREGRTWSLFTESPLPLWEIDCSAAFASLDAHPQPLDDDASAAALRKIRYIAINEATLGLFEARTPDELLHALPRLFERPHHTLLGMFAARQARATRYEAELPIRTLLDKTRHVSLRVNVLPGYEVTWARAVVSMYDLTSRKEHEAVVQAALREKEVMLRELNHRIKNNLQVISSLLSLQSQQLSDPTMRTAFAESQSRVQAIALVHDQLYHSRNLAAVDVGDYLRQLVGSLCRAHDAARRGIAPVIDAGAVELAVDLAIPCGLLVNELVTNALRHAFPTSPGRPGTITVALAREGSRVTLAVSDDGIGLPATIDPERTKTLGLGLVLTFAEQLEARWELSRANGTAFRFAFTVPG